MSMVTGKKAKLSQRSLQLNEKQHLMLEEQSIPVGSGKGALEAVSSQVCSPA